MRVSPITATICVLGMVLAALGIYFGAILPLAKAQSYLDAQRRMPSVHTIDDFKANFDASFNLYSPVGDEEIAKFLGNDILNIVNQGQSEDVSRELVSYMEGHMFKDDVRHLLVLGQMYQILWQSFHKEEDYQKAISYLEKTHELGPNLPPPMYKLLNLYVLHGDKENAQRVANLILANWPEDKNVKTFLSGK
jgi:tetratricopeptide (TPR) repeat protein